MSDSKVIVALGGSVIKTAHDEIKEVARRKMFDVLIHNGGSLFHDFQRATEELDSHSHPLEDLLKDYSVNKEASLKVWDWVGRNRNAPRNSLTKICQERLIEVFIFTALGADFFQLFGNSHSWELLARRCYGDFGKLCSMMRGPFRFVCMGSAVVHPEVFRGALAVARPKEFKADVVDFLDMYRPRTRVARYGDYYRMTHKEYLDKVISGEVKWREERSVPHFQESTGDGD